METARLFQNGQSQAVRLPKEFRFSGDKVFIQRVGAGVMLLPFHDPWQVMFDSLELFTDDFMVDRQQPEQPAREDLFA